MPGTFNSDSATIGAAIGAAGVSVGSLLGYFAESKSPSPARNTNSESESPSLTRQQSVSVPANPLPGSIVARMFGRIPGTVQQESRISINLDDLDETTPDTAREPSQDCHVCLSSFGEINARGDEIRATRCGHLFCAECLQECLVHAKICPVCRRRVSFQETIRVFL